MDGPPAVRCRRIFHFSDSNQAYESTICMILGDLYENRKEINLLFTKGFTIIKTYLLHQCSEITRELYD